MTDRELLELAAKAAGMEYSDRQWSEYDEDYVTWNPLDDDGDALRLAVKLRIELEFGSDFVNTGRSQNLGEWHLAQEKLSDPYAATRRAIVRAAAEIGRNM